jgi:hypothetical protein
MPCERHRHRQLGQRAEDRRQPLGVVGVVRPVQGRQQERLGGVDALGQLGRRELAGPDLVADAQADVDHHVTGQPGAVRQALRREVAHGLLGRGQQQVGAVVGEDAVVLLRHAPVEGAQAGLQVGDRQVHLHGGQRAGDGGVGVAVDEHPVGLLAVQHRVERREHRAGLHAVAAGADAEVDVGVRDAEAGEEDVGEVRVVMLPGVHDDVLVLSPGEGRGDGRELHQLRTGPDDADDFH